MKRNIEIWIAVWKDRLQSPKLIIISVGLTAFLIFGTLNETPAGPVCEIIARVETFGVTQSFGGSGIYLVCILDNGKRVNVYLRNPFNEPALNIQKGQMVKLKESSRLLSDGKIYHFVSSIHPEVNTQVK